MQCLDFTYLDIVGWKLNFAGDLMLQVPKSKQALIKNLNQWMDNMETKLYMKVNMNKNSR